jgi:hypothetical protein
MLAEAPSKRRSDLSESMSSAHRTTRVSAGPVPPPTRTPRRLTVARNLASGFDRHRPNPNLSGIRRFVRSTPQIPLAAAGTAATRVAGGNVVEHHLLEVMLCKFCGAPLAVTLGFEAKSPERLRATFVPLALDTEGYERGQGVTERTT